MANWMKLSLISEIQLTLSMKVEKNTGLILRSIKIIEAKARNKKLDFLKESVSLKFCLIMKMREFNRLREIWQAMMVCCASK